MSSPIECSQCHRPSEAGARFCTGCGGSLLPKVHCPACDYLQATGARFCMGCGAAMAGATFHGQGELADGAVVEGVWQRGPEEFIRRLAPEDCRTFLGSRVVRIPPGTVGVVVVGGVVERLLPAGEQTTVPLLERIANFFTGKGADTAFYLLDLRPLAIPFAVKTRPSSQGRSVQAQLLATFQVPRGDRDAVGTFLLNVLGARAGFTAGDLYNLLRPEVTRLAALVLERLANDGELEYAAAESELRRVLSEQLGRRYGLVVDVGIAPLTSTASLAFHLGQSAEQALYTADGEAVEVELVVRVQGQHEDFQPARLQPALYAALAARLRALPRARLASGEGFAAVEEALRTDAARELMSFGMQLVSISVIDVREKTGVWLLGARAELNRAQAELGVRRQWLEQSANEVDLLELATQQTLRRQQVEREGRLRALGSELAAARRETGLRTEDAFEKDKGLLLDRQRRQELQQGQSALDVSEAQQSAQRQLEVDAAARAVAQARLHNQRRDELAELQHGADKGSAAQQARAAQARAELQLEAEQRQQRLALDSERARRLAEDAAYATRQRDDAAFAEHARRAALQKELEDHAEARQLDKLRAMAELDQKLAAQEGEQKLKLRESLRGLSEREMLVMQATELSQSPGGAAWAEALAAGAAQQEKELRLGDKERHSGEVKELLREQSAAMQAVMQAQLARMEALAERALQTTAERQRDAGAAALHERSLDAMARVAAARAAPAPVVAAVAAAGEAAQAGRCKTCAAALRPDARFCAACGSGQGA